MRTKSELKPSFTSPLPRAAQKNGGCSQSIMLLLCHSSSVSSRLHHGVPPTECTPSQTDPMWASSSRIVPHCVHNMGYSPSGTDCSSMGPPQVAAPNRPLTPLCTLLHGLKFWPRICSCVGSPCAIPTALSWIFSQATYALQWWNHGLQRDSPLYHCPLCRPQGNLSSGTCSDSPLTLSSFTLMCLQGCFSLHFLSTLSHRCCSGF